MALTLTEQDVTEPAVVGPTPAEEFVDQYLCHMGMPAVAKPMSEIPTLIGAPADMDMRTADRLHSEASRWLEYIERILSKAEAEQLLAKHNVATLKRRYQFVYKRNWVEGITLGELENLEALERLEVEAQAKVVSLRGVQSALNKVNTKASRTITVHSKATLQG